MTATTIKDGDYVTHATLPQWGLGKVIELLESGAVRVFFEFAGEKKMQRDFLAVAEAPQRHPVLEKMDRTRALDGTISFPDLEAVFLKLFPGGFDDQRYVTQERTSRFDAVKLLRETLDQDTLAGLLRAGDYETVALLAKKLLSKTSLIFPNEKTALSDGLKRGDEQRELFARALETLLYGDGEIGPRFNGFVEALDKLDACKWSIATYFLCLLDPTLYIFIKPAVYQRASQAYGFDIGYGVRPSWGGYQRMLGLVAYVAKQLETRELLAPHDLIDVQSFIVCSLSNEKLTTRAPKTVRKAKA